MCRSCLQVETGVKLCCLRCRRATDMALSHTACIPAYFLPTLPCGVCTCNLLCCAPGRQVLVVENHVHLPAALSQLRCSMQDPLVAIDLEWRPQFGKGFTPVAMVQLASSRCV